MKKRIKPLYMFIIFLIIIATYIFIDNNTISVTEYEMNFENLPVSFDGYKIMLVADFHNASYFEQVIKKIKISNPDIILFAGDMISYDDQNFDNVEKLISGIKETAPIYAVTGNHEEWTNDPAVFVKFLEKQGVSVLQNVGVDIKRNNESILLYGIRDPIVRDKDLAGSEQIKSIREFTDRWVRSNFFNILVIHRANIYQFISDCSYDLILSGHKHGGLIKIPFVGGLISPEMDIFPKYTNGIYSENDSKMVVSRGLDKNIKRLRIFNGPELVMVVLKKQVEK